MFWRHIFLTSHIMTSSDDHIVEDNSNTDGIDLQQCITCNQNLKFNPHNIRILHECEVRIENSVPRVTVWHHEALPSDAKQWSWGMEIPSRGSLFGITRLCRVMQNSDPEGWNFLSAPNTDVISRDGIFYPHRTLMILFLAYLLISNILF